MSDFHLGFGIGTERYDEAFDNAEQAIRLALANNPDAILHAGDFFDKPVPSQETWEHTFRIFSGLSLTKSNLKGVRIKKGSREEITFTHIPFVAIHGTHEYRGSDFANALDVLESAGYIVHIHAARIELSSGSKTVVVHGLSGIPEKKALDALKLWNPKPVEGACNIMLFHQSIKEFLPFDDNMVATISMADLPKGFDLVVDGHLHWHSEENLPGLRLLLSGSTLTTQLKKLESKKPKGIFIFDTKTKELNFLALPRQRDFFYEKLQLDNADQQQVRRAVKSVLSRILSRDFEIKPLVRIKLSGTLAKGISPSDIVLSDFAKEFSENAIISFSLDFEEKSFRKKLDGLRRLQSSKKSIASLGIEMLEKNLKETQFNSAFDARRLFELLAGGRLEDAVAILIKSRNTDANFFK